MYNICKTYRNAIDLKVQLQFDKAAGDVQDIGIVTFQVVDTLPTSEILIGWHTLKQRAVLCRCTTSLVHKKIAPISHVLHISQLQRPHGVAYDVRDVDDEYNTDHESDSEPVPANQFLRRNFVCAIKVGSRRKPGRTRHISDLLDYEPESHGDDEKVDDLDEALQATSVSDSDEFVLPTDITGPETLQRKLRRLVDKYKKCFRKNVAKTAANIPPMKLNVNVDEWTKSTQSKGRYLKLSKVMRRMTK
jgi:hypothetical protein